MSLGAIGLNCWTPDVGWLLPGSIWCDRLKKKLLRSSLPVRVAAVVPITSKVPTKISKHEVTCTSFPMLQHAQHGHLQCVLDVNESLQYTQITYPPGI